MMYSTIQCNNGFIFRYPSRYILNSSLKWDGDNVHCDFHFRKAFHALKIVFSEFQGRTFLSLIINQSSLDVFTTIVTASIHYLLLPYECQDSTGKNKRRCSKIILFQDLFCLYLSIVAWYLYLVIFGGGLAFSSGYRWYWIVQYKTRSHHEALFWIRHTDCLEGRCVMIFTARYLRLNEDDNCSQFYYGVVNTK